MFDFCPTAGGRCKSKTQISRYRCFLRAWVGAVVGPAAAEHRQIEHAYQNMCGDRTREIKFKWELK